MSGATDSSKRTGTSLVSPPTASRLSITAVAVLKDVSVDQDDGHTSTTITPVVSFTTREGTAVTAHCTSNLPDPAGAYGRDVTVHHTPADPADFTLDRAAEHRSQTLDVTLHCLTLVVLMATTAAGVLLL